MKTLPVLILVLLFFSCQEKNTSNKLYTINPIIGDVSYQNQFGTMPTADCNEQVRIKTHLAYVENLLRNKSTEGLSASAITSRHKLLDHLRDYFEAGVFPKNYDYADQRRPCFIDRNGNICAVGYLVEQSAGLASAAAINNSFQYATISEMKSELLENWITQSGLTKNEVAMIQPTYGLPSNQHKVGYGFATTSSFFTLANISLSTASLANWSNNDFNKNVPRYGLLSGATSLGFNALILQPSATNTAQKRLSNINLFSSVTAIGINGFRLLNYKREKKNKKVSWNFDMQPGLNNQPRYTLAVQKRF